MRKETAGSAVPRRQVGRRLQELRESACLTRRTVANALFISESTLWRMERGLNLVRPSEAEQLCRLYGASTEVTEPVVALAAISMRKGWWFRDSDMVPAWHELYTGLENEAVQQTQFEPRAVPALLQTAGYARALVSGLHPDWKPGRVQEHVEFRMSRQALLSRPTASVSVEAVIDEGVVHRRIGSDEIMNQQLMHLNEMSSWPNVSLRVVPFGAGFHPGMRSGAFIILDFADNVAGKPSEEPVVYVEGLTGSAYLDSSEDVLVHRDAFAAISGAALDERDSRELLEQCRTGDDGSHTHTFLDDVLYGPHNRACGR